MAQIGYFLPPQLFIELECKLDEGWTKAKGKQSEEIDARRAWVLTDSARKNRISKRIRSLRIL
jgi:hypothetical protein